MVSAPHRYPGSPGHRGASPARKRPSSIEEEEEEEEEEDAEEEQLLPSDSVSQAGVARRALPQGASKPT